MNINNKEAVKLIRQLKEFCENKTCNLCCFADDIDGHCMISDDIPINMDIKTFEKQAEDLIE